MAKANQYEPACIPGSPYDTGNKKAGIKASITKSIYFKQLFEIAVSRVKATGLPDTVDMRYLMQQLIMNGYALWFNEKDMGDIVTSCGSFGPLNIYGIPTKRYPISTATTGIVFEPRTIKDSVLIYNNYSHTNDLLTIMEYAQKLENIDQMIQVNVKANKTPVFVVASKATGDQLSKKNIVRMLDENIPYIPVTDDFNAESLQSLNTSAPVVFDRLYQLKEQLMNEAVRFLGVANLTVKAEYTGAHEGATQNQVAYTYRRSFLQSLNDAADKINKNPYLETNNLHFEWAIEDEVDKIMGYEESEDNSYGISDNETEDSM